jgi:hypothetical protein
VCDEAKQPRMGKALTGLRHTFTYDARIGEAHIVTMTTAYIPAFTGGLLQPLQGRLPGDFENVPIFVYLSPHKNLLCTLFGYFYPYITLLNFGTLEHYCSLAC